MLHLTTEGDATAAAPTSAPSPRREPLLPETGGSEAPWPDRTATRTVDTANRSVASGKRPSTRLAAENDLAASVGFTLPERYNASRLLWDAPAERVALRTAGADWTYRALREEAGRIGNALLSSGCRPGSRVGLVLDDVPAFPAAVMGAMRAGLIPVLLDPNWTAERLAVCLDDAAVSAVVVSAAHLGAVPPARCPRILVADERPWANETEALAEADTHRAGIAFLLYSSGATGAPKGIVHRHEDAPYTAATYARSHLGIGPDDVTFSAVKLFHAYGFGNALTFPFSVGAGAVLMDEPADPAAVFARIIRHRPTIFFGTPAIYAALLGHPTADAVDLSSVRLFVSTVESLSPLLASAWAARFGRPIVEGFGSTELLHIYLSNTADRQKPGSAGRVVPGYEVRLMTPAGEPARPGEEGILWVKGLSATRQYWNGPERTAEACRDGWVVTGDRFTRDADGFHHFRGRADDLQTVAGHWTWPLEIESALNTHPMVKEACVQAVERPDRRLTVKAWVAPAAGVAPCPALADELRAYARRILLPHKYPREIVFLDALPRTGADRIDRQALRRV